MRSKTKTHEHKKPMFSTMTNTTQIIKDLNAKGLPCASMHEAMEQSYQVAVANNCALVGIFDQIPDSVQFGIEARCRDKSILVVIDEAHQILQEKWRLVMYRAWEFGNQLTQQNVVCAWLLLSGTLRTEEELPLADALSLVRIHTVLRGSARTENLNVEVSAFSCNACIENLTSEQSDSTNRHTSSCH